MESRPKAFLLLLIAGNAAAASTAAAPGALALGVGGEAAEAILKRFTLEPPRPAPPHGWTVGTAYTPKQLHWEVRGARALRLEGPRDGGWLFSVDGGSAAARAAMLHFVRDGKAGLSLLRLLDAQGGLLRWELVGREGAEGIFDGRGTLVTGRSWHGDEQTVLFRGIDAYGRPQLKFHKYRKGRKAGSRTVTIDPKTGRPVQIEELDGAGRLVRLAALGKDGLTPVVEVDRQLGATAAPPPPRPKPRPAPAPRIAAPPAKPPAAPRWMSAPPGTLASVTEAKNGTFASAAAAVRRFGPTIGRARRVVIQSGSGAQTWLVRRESEGHALDRKDVVNELVMREVLRSFYPDVFEAAPAVGFEAGGKAALVEGALGGATPQPGWRPWAPKERAALASLSLVFGLADLGVEHFLWRENRKPALTGLFQVRREPFNVGDDLLPLIPVEIRLGRVPFVRVHPPLPREDYEEEASRVRRELQAPGFGERFRGRLGRAGLTEEEAKSYWDAALSNLARFDRLLEPYLSAAAGLGDLTDAP